MKIKRDKTDRRSFWTFWAYCTTTWKLYLEWSPLHRLLRFNPSPCLSHRFSCSLSNACHIRLQNSRFRKGGSAVLSVILLCEAREPHKYIGNVLVSLFGRLVVFQKCNVRYVYICARFWTFELSWPKGSLLYNRSAMLNFREGPGTVCPDVTTVTVSSLRVDVASAGLEVKLWITDTPCNLLASD